MTVEEVLEDSFGQGVTGFLDLDSRECKKILFTL